ncbi:MAG: Maf family nucleotide pyrophosphatase [Desulfuromonadales bacterium]|jgi:septum formation protein|nr:Maf family nucleotide pyrophosphatase [Desulfuromonadales bacterium]
MRTLVLASTSPYRLQLMRQLELSFHVAAPRYKERMDASVSAELLVKHQALQKAKSIAEKYDDALIIGSDQVFVDSRHRVLGKPGTPAKAIEQLQEMQGRKHTFYTGLAIYDSASGESLTEFDTFSVTMRELTEEQIKHYVAKENPVDCAGSFKIEGLGIALMEKMTGNDYNTLIGLPLILLVNMLNHFKVEVL